MRLTPAGTPATGIPMATAGDIDVVIANSIGVA
jgi:hypothetical protein